MVQEIERLVWTISLARSLQIVIDKLMRSLKKSRNVLSQNTIGFKPGRAVSNPGNEVRSCS